MNSLIREARREDYPHVKEIARLTWEGHDYLPQVFDSWIEDGHFYVIEEDGEVVATAKLTLLPCDVGWMEGLRVHPSYRGRGLARRLHEFLISLGREMSARGELKSLMYATYVKNEASIHLGESTGFKVVKKFHHLYKEPEHAGVQLRETEPRLPDVELVPVGWKFLKKCGDTLDWLRNHAEAYGIDDEGFLMPKEPTTTFTPFRYSEMQSVLGGMEAIALERGSRVSIMVPEDMSDSVSRLRQLGLVQWELEEPDILVFELRLRA
ncbi:MAG: GNAT family N-acetyltransferase [Candidatus Korarchaeota archaeon]|nr:GNAT family N-acetyltransferase [Candidatus Korarchaeota archaeon]